MKNNYLSKLSNSTGCRGLAGAYGSGKGRRALSAKLLAAFAFMLIFTGSAFAQTAYIPVPPASNGTSGNNRGPSGSVAYQRVASIYSAAEMANLNPAYPLTSLGFNIATPANLAATGTIKIYLVNTTDPSFLRSTTWANFIGDAPAMQLVYDGPLTIPAAAGWYDIPFTTPFNYTGGSMYMGFEWTRTSAATTAPVYNCNATPVGGADGWRGITSNIAHQPAFSATTSAFRPWIRVGYTPPANDAAVNAVYTMGKLPLNSAVIPHVVSASVTNMGAQDLVNHTFTLTVTGANTFTTSVTVPLITSMQTMVIDFPGFTPTNLGTNTITVTAPADDFAGNNTATYTQIVEPSTISHAQGNPPVPTSGGGFNTGSGGIFSKYTVTSPVSVPVVRIGIANNAASVGQRVFAVILNSAGQQVGRSAGYIIQAGDQGNLVSFTIPTPPVVLGDFYVGLAQTIGSVGYFPLGLQAETPTRPGAFFSVGSDTTFTGSTPFSPVTTLGRFIIEADLVAPATIDLTVTAITGLSSACGLSSTSQVCAIIQNLGGDPQSNIPVRVSVNGGTPVTEIIPGPLAPGDTMTYCFTQTLDLSAVGSYSIVVATMAAGDANPNNDSTAITINSLANIPTTFGNIPSSICATAAPIQLSGTPAGGTFSGTGVSGNMFDPSVAGAGSQTITYTVTQGACTGTATATIMVDALPAAPTATGASRCGPGSVTLSATAPTGNVAWYAAATGGSPLTLGNTFTTPSLATTTTYYAASITNFASVLVPAGNVGPLNGTAVGAGGAGGPFTNEMIFSALQPLRIDSVTLISTGAGTYTIVVRDRLASQGGLPIDTAVVTVPGAGTHRVYLGLEVPASGTGYTLGLLSATAGSGALFRNTAGATYPYTLTDVIAITGADFDNDPLTTRYYNFYNWSVSVIGSACQSSRVPVEATINAAPSAAFTFAATGNTVNFTATSTTGTYSWTFAGGTPATSTVANPTVTFATAGTHTVTLTVTENGCSATTSQVVMITGRDADLNNAFNLYPNPSTGLVQLEVTGTSTVERVEVYSALGQQVKSFNFAGQQHVSLDLSGLAEGAYTLRVTGQNTVLVKQLLLQK